MVSVWLREGRSERDSVSVCVCVCVCVCVRAGGRVMARAYRDANILLYCLQLYGWTGCF